jgi:hypothetical protein
MIWKTGAVLTSKKAKVLVEYSNYQRRITLYAYGEDEYAAKYLTIIRQRLMLLIKDNYEALEYDPQITMPQGERLNWRDISLRYAKEKEMARIYSGSNEYDAKQLLQKYIGVKGKPFETALMQERELMKGGSIVINVNNILATQINQTDSTKFKSVLDIFIIVDEKLKEIEESIEDLREDQKEKAAHNDSELKLLSRELHRFHKDIDEFKSVSQDTSAELEQTTIMTRIKKRWEKISTIAGQLKNVTDIVEKIINIALYIEKIPWKDFLPHNLITNILS